MPLIPVPISVAETSPERGIYYHTSRHSAGKPVVAGWSYSWCAQLGETSSSWTAPVDVSRVPIEMDAHDIAGQQMQLVRASLPTGVAPLFAFDGGYDPTRLAEHIGEAEAAVLVRLCRNRCFFFDPIHDPKPLGGRPRQHGAKFACNDPSTWPKPDVEHVEADEGYGYVRVRAWRGLHAKVQNHVERGSHKTRAILKGTVILLEVSKLPREIREPKAFWLWWRGPGRQRAQQPPRMTPSRVRRKFIELLPVLGTPASIPKPCGKSPGRPKGRLSGRAARFPARRRRTSNAKHLDKPPLEQQQVTAMG